MTHTPSPWRIHTFTPSGWSTQTTTILGPDDVAIVGGVHWGSADGSVGAANARLIASAPLLLEALREAFAYECSYPDEQHPSCSPWHELARAAIAKVEGRE